VIAACCERSLTTVCIEQPELHLHPRLQAELGDLIITGALGHQKSEFYLSDADGNEVTITVPKSMIRRNDVAGAQEPELEEDEPAEDDDMESDQPSAPHRAERRVRIPRTMIVETHSGLLVLRILRRIRETSG